MNRRYYALEDIAYKLYKVGKECDLKNYFTQIASNPDFVNDYSLFEQNYGIDKNGNDKGVAISLISKYAYFETGCNFPIYDSIACEMIPLIWKFCEWESLPKFINYKKNTLKVDGKATIISFIKTINLMIQKLGGNISYDHLDRLLWFVGKIRRGNLSLILDKKQYRDTIETYMDLNSDSKYIFDIETVDLNKLQYLKNNKILFEFFKLAKKIGSKKSTLQLRNNNKQIK